MTAALALMLALPALAVRPAAVAAAPQAALLRVAILPFDDLARQPRHAYLSQGIAEALMGGLRYVPQLVLVDRLQVGKALKEQAFSQSGLTDTRTSLALGKALAANWLLVGSYQVAGEQVRIDARLMDAETGLVDQRRTFSVSGYLDDVFGLQDRLAQQVAKGLGAEPGPEERRRMAAVIQSTGNAEAYQLYLRGRDQYAKLTAEGFEAAGACYRQAVTLDDHYALAWAGIAESEALLGFHTRRAPAVAAGHFEQARQAAGRAMAANPTLAEAHRAMAYVETNAMPRQADKAEQHARRALALNPNDAETWYVLGSALGGDAASYRRALALEPNLAMAHNDLGYVLLRQGDLTGAAAAFNRMRSLATLAPEGHVGLARVALAQRQYERAVTLLQGALRLAPDQAEWQLDLALAYQGLKRTSDAIQAAETALGLAPDLARAHLLLGSLYQPTDRARAATHFRRFVTLAPRDPQAAQVREWLQD
jgi:adenylate cyclase